MSIYDHHRLRHRHRQFYHLYISFRSRSLNWIQFFLPNVSVTQRTWPCQPEIDSIKSLWPTILWRLYIVIVIVKTLYYHCYCEDLILFCIVIVTTWQHYEQNLKFLILYSSAIIAHSNISLLICLTPRGLFFMFPISALPLLLVCRTMTWKSIQQWETKPGRH